MKHLYQDEELIALFENAYEGAEKKLIHMAAKDVASTMADRATILNGPAWSLLVPPPIKEAMEARKYVLANLLAHTENEIMQWPGVDARCLGRLARYLATNGLERLWPPTSQDDSLAADEAVEVVLLDTLADKLYSLTRMAFLRPFEARGVSFMAALGAIKAIWDKTAIFFGDPRKLGIPNTLAVFMREENIQNFHELLGQNELLLYAKGLKPEDMQAVYAILDDKGLMAFVR